MRYKVSGIHIDIGDALSQHVRTELDEAVAKYAERPTSANVVFSKDANEFLCEATVHLSTGLTAAAKARAFDIYEAFDKCREKLEKQLRRYKRRLKDHHKKRKNPIETVPAASYVLAATPDGAEDEHEATEPDQPVIVAEMETAISTLSVGEAVMQMELTDTHVLLFRNERNGQLNAVYRRDDGNIGWIDPANGA